ncbi:hypothetical protein CK820_G0044486 [Pan troglodytes]|uniref:Uncharacterized protein n=1 Tax=Pan troglodytes TaxID=9598 RepID=A0A2J8JTE1_PANTR|nr:hypothetical protein CK820_G0044486 [Pan troglodytes]
MWARKRLTLLPRKTPERPENAAVEGLFREGRLPQKQVLHDSSRKGISWKDIEHLTKSRGRWRTRLRQEPRPKDSPGPPGKRPTWCRALQHTLAIVPRGTP